MGLGGWFASIWKTKIGTIAGERVSLDGIEHAKIRALYHDERVHACLVCASVSRRPSRPVVLRSVWGSGCVRMYMCVCACGFTGVSVGCGSGSGNAQQ